MATLRFPKGMSAVLGLIGVAVLLAVVAVWPGMGSAAAQDKPLQPTVVQPAQPPALPPTFDPKKSDLKQPPPLLQPGFGPPGGPVSSPKDLAEKQRQIDEKMR